MESEVLNGKAFIKLSCIRHPWVKSQLGVKWVAGRFLTREKGVLEVNKIYYLDLSHTSVHIDEGLHFPTWSFHESTNKAFHLAVP